MNENNAGKDIIKNNNYSTYTNTESYDSYINSNNKSHSDNNNSNNKNNNNNNNNNNRIMISLTRELKQNYQLYILVLPAVLYFLIFCYIPMYGAQIAFKEFVPHQGILASKWVGFSQFERFFNSYQFKTLFSNTLLLSLYNLVAGFPVPIILALMLNQLSSSKLKKVVQTATYAPHFISVAALCGMMVVMLSPTGGIFYKILEAIFGENLPIPLGNPRWFRTIYVVSGIWQHAGWEAIIYIAALTSVNPDLYEAADIDGAGKLKKIIYIDFPSIIPTAITLLILNAGKIMSIGFEKVFLMQNSMNLATSEIISTYVYKIGIIGSEFSYSSAIGLFNSIINLILVITINYISKKYKETSLW
ncbi:MAG TPA: ABC transporter permease subunit [Clostridiales bacterium]|nr:ABC transporter permease subunit [Clostridiales bacterium]